MHLLLVSVFVSLKTDTVLCQSESENIYCEQEKTLVQLPLARKSATHRELNFNSKFREHCIIIFLDILDCVEKLKVEMARRKIDSNSLHNKIFIPRPKDIRGK